VGSANAVEQPIINDAFSEPPRHWEFDQGIPELKEGRRPAGYYLAPRTRDAIVPRAAEARVDLPLVNRIRERVRAWRQANYPGTTRVTRILLEHWTRQDRDRKLFFCQVEAAETIIWLTESHPASRQGIEVAPDVPEDAKSKVAGYGPLKRLGCKMATGSGKTVVMAMLIAWSVLNKVSNKQDTRFSDAAVLICPNLTIKERDKVLIPGSPGNYYDEFDLVPRTLLPSLAQGKFQVVNWQQLSEDKDPTRSVVKRGEETPGAFAKRVLRNLGDKKNLLVLNDEAHHAYRPALRDLGTEQDTLDEDEDNQTEQKEREEEAEEATVWVGALDKINKARGINFCIDMSATPFYIKGSGHAEGEPFPWLISEFGLVDAIESGIVKIPRIPVDDNSGQPIPKYFRLWHTIMQVLPPVEREASHRKAKPESVVREAEGALQTLASQWEKTLSEFEEKKFPVPPVMIVVCANTDLAKLVYNHIASGKVMARLRNNGELNTLHIDSRELEEAENQVEPGEKETAAEKLRKMVSTVGKEGEPGQNLKCVVSVAMLNEGWDARNVTQILGLRAFSSQLLCEQVVGRGLRRTNYDDLSKPEYVDVYGVPFEVIPVQRGSLNASLPVNLPTLVKALPERKDFEIRFPRVEGFVFDVRHKIRADVEKIPPLVIDPAKEPTELVAKDAVVVKVGRPDRLGPGKEVYQDRDIFHQTHRLQSTIYEIAAEITNGMSVSAARQILFPQVKEIVRSYVETKVRVRKGAVLEEVALLRYKDIIVTRVRDAIEPDTEAGETPILPVIERYRNSGSTSEVMFRTVKDVAATRKSHVSHVVLDSKWEHSFAYDFEKNPYVISYVKNDHLDFVIPYEFEGLDRNYYPDYILKVANKDGCMINLILEVKGFESEKDRAKKPAANRWVEAVNNHGGYGVWRYVQATSKNMADLVLGKIHGTELNKSEKARAEKLVSPAPK
jgi:type III restriction enzyme